MSQQHCVGCGATRAADEVFCTTCGRRFDGASTAPTLAGTPAPPPPPPPGAAMPSTPYVAPPPPPQRRTATVVGIAAAGVVAVVLLALLLAGLVGGDDDDTEPVAGQDEITTTTRLTTTTTTRPPSTTTTVTTTTTAAPTTTPPNTTAPPSTGLPAGLYCRDLKARGLSYAAAVDYWYRQGEPSRMDADGNGVPCETVYPASEIEAYWGYQWEPPAGGDDAATAIRLVEDALYGCGYAPALETSTDGQPDENGRYLVLANADVGYDVLAVAYRVMPSTGELVAVDQVSAEVLACQA